MIIGEKVTNPGELRTRVTIQRRVTSAGTGGFTVQAWDDLAVVWAKWVNAHGQEAVQVAMLEATGLATVTIRYRVGVDETCALLKGSERYEIISMDDVRERGEYIELKVRRMKTG